MELKQQVYDLLLDERSNYLFTNIKIYDLLDTLPKSEREKWFQFCEERAKIQNQLKDLARTVENV